MTDASQLLTFGTTVSFDIYPAEILGAHFRNVKVKAILDADTARTWMDVEAVHANVYPTLPSGVPNDPTQYPFIKFVQTNGEVLILGQPWIRADTITTSVNGQLILTLNDKTFEDQQEIVRAINALGHRIDRVDLQ